MNKDLDEGLRTPHSSRPLIVTLKKAFDYYKDIESYPMKYPNYCKRIEILDHSDDTLTSKEFWNISLDNDTDHVLIKVKYIFYPPTKISYEIIDGYNKAVGIKNYIKLDKSNIGMCSVNYNNTFLDLVCYPPHIMRRNNSNQYLLQRYYDYIDYFIWQDCIHLEEKPIEGFKEGDICNQCKDGNLEVSPKAEDYSHDNYRRRIKVLKCNKCDQEFKMIHAYTSDEISFKQT